jgi:hypothetical protein
MLAGPTTVLQTGHVLSFMEAISCHTGKRLPYTARPFAESTYPVTVPVGKIDGTISRNLGIV